MNRIYNLSKRTTTTLPVKRININEKTERIVFIVVVIL
jgi:hypothetical protein